MVACLVYDSRGSFFVRLPGFKVHDLGGKLQTKLEMYFLSIPTKLKLYLSLMQTPLPNVVHSNPILKN